MRATTVCFADEALAYAGHADVTILPPPCAIAVQPMDFGHAEELMTRAGADARAFLGEHARRVVPYPERRARRRALLRHVDLPSAG